MGDIGQRPKAEDNIVGYWEGKIAGSNVVAHKVHWCQDGTFAAGEKRDYTGTYQYSKGLYRHLDKNGGVIEGIVEWVNENEFVHKVVWRGTTTLHIITYQRK